MATSTNSTYGISPALYNQLQKLSKQGKLNQVPPELLAMTIQAEGQTPGRIVTNSNGSFGSWFDLIPNSPYGRGNTYITLTPAELRSTSTASFDKQAQAASVVWANALSSASGDIYQAANIYQTGYPNAQAAAVNGVSNWQPGDLASSVLGSYGLQPGQNLQGWAPNAGGGKGLSQGAAVPTNALGQPQQSSGCALSIFGACILSNSTLTAIKGGALIAGGSLVMVIGVSLIFKTSATQALTKGLAGIVSGGSGGRTPAPAPESETLLLENEQLAFSQGVAQGQRQVNYKAPRPGRSVAAAGPGEDDF